jgi:hypothetical protein
MLTHHLHAPMLDSFGFPLQHLHTAVSGLHFLGLNDVKQCSPGILYGVGDNAEAPSRQINNYLSV